MFLNGVANVTAGNTAEVQATWMLPLPMTSFNAASAKWEVLDQDGSVWAFGDADDLEVKQAPFGSDTHIVVGATISVPVSAPADTGGSGYQVRWTLSAAGQNDQFAFDSFTVFPRIAQLQGPANSVALVGDMVEMQLTLPSEFKPVHCEVFHENTGVTPKLEATSVAIAGGIKYMVNLQTDTFRPGVSLTPYTLIWQYGPDGQKVMEQASLWLVNPTIIQAQAEIRQFMLKAYADTGIDPDGEFTPDVLLMHLLQGCEMFNALGYPTTFNMTRASGPIRALWLRASIIQACRSQYLNEGMKAFQFGGQAVNLDVDRSQYWDSIASSLQSELDQAIKPFKENLVRRGLLGGDGNINPNSLRFGAVGAIGIAITPVSPIRAFSPLAGGNLDPRRF
jgi:hypothetical protein